MKQSGGGLGGVYDVWYSFVLDCRCATCCGHAHFEVFSLDANRQQTYSLLLLLLLLLSYPFLFLLCFVVVIPLFILLASPEFMNGVGWYL